MAPIQPGDPAPRAASPSRWRLMAFPALAALFAFGVALALPQPPAPGVAQPQACAAAEVALPPGHPPIDGRTLLPRGQARLPPGHPPVPGRGASRPAPPLQPTFEPPQVLEI